MLSERAKKTIAEAITKRCESHILRPYWLTNQRVLIQPKTRRGPEDCLCASGELNGFVAGWNARCATEKELLGMRPGVTHAHEAVTHH